MKATVYYIELTEEQRVELNGIDDVRDSRIGWAYVRAKNGNVDGTNFDLLVKAATMGAESAEQIWTALQNVFTSWSARDDIECHTVFPRSMNVGDIVVWEDGRRESCADIGFETIEVS